jgi:hypothetical protein
MKIYVHYFDIEKLQQESKADLTSFFNLFVVHIGPFVPPRGVQ